MKIRLGILVLFALATSVLAVAPALAAPEPATKEKKPARTTPPTRDPNTPGYVKATELPDGAVAPAEAHGNFIIGPTHAKPPEMSPKDGVPQGIVHELTMSSADSKIYPGITREPNTHGTPDPNDPANLVVTTSHPAPWTRKV